MKSVADIMINQTNIFTPSYSCVHVYWAMPKWAIFVFVLHYNTIQLKVFYCVDRWIYVIKSFKMSCMQLVLSLKTCSRAILGCTERKEWHTACFSYFSTTKTLKEKFLIKCTYSIKCSTCILKSLLDKLSVTIYIAFLYVWYGHYSYIKIINFFIILFSWNYFSER